MESYTEFSFSDKIDKIAKEFSKSLKNNSNLWKGKYSKSKREIFLEKMRLAYTDIVSTFKGKHLLGFKFKPADNEISYCEKSYVVDVYIKTKPAILVMRVIFDTHTVLYNQNHIVLFEAKDKSLYYDTEISAFHTPDGREKLKDAVRRKSLKAWKSKNHSFYNDLDQSDFEIQKGSWGTEDYIDPRFIALRLKEKKLGFYAEDIYDDWQKTEFGKYFNEDNEQDVKESIPRSSVRLTKDYFGHEDKLIVFVDNNEKTNRNYRFRFKFDNGYGCLVCESGDREKPFSIVPVYYNKSNEAYHVDTSVLNLPRKDTVVPITRKQVKKVLSYLESLPTRFTYNLDKNTFGKCDRFYEETEYGEGDPIFRWKIKLKHSTVSIFYMEGEYKCNADSFMVLMKDDEDGNTYETMSLTEVCDYIAQVRSRESNSFVLNKYFRKQ